MYKKSPLETYIREKRESKPILLMTHLVLGYPNFDDCYEMVKQMVEAGVDLIELQIPFSEPMADGPVILAANQAALDRQVTLDQCLDFAKRVTQNFPIPFLFMGYGNTFYRYGMEKMAQTMKKFFKHYEGLTKQERNCEVIMSILSNYTPDCLVECSVECSLQELDDIHPGLSGKEFAEKFLKAAKIAELDIYRATTHNKGIFNGIDAVALATGNDFRSIEANGHVWASKSGKYKSLTKASVWRNRFRYTLTLPLSVGTVGGLTSLHPLAKFGLELLGKPSAKELMMITAAAGLANNFGALRSLVTTGIQQGHMKMHLSNLLNALKADYEEKKQALEYFAHKTVSYSEVEAFIKSLRTKLQ